MFATTNKCVSEWYFLFELKSGLNEVLLLGHLLQNEARDSNMDTMSLENI